MEWIRIDAAGLDHNSDCAIRTFSIHQISFTSKKIRLNKLVVVSNTILHPDILIVSHNVSSHSTYSIYSRINIDRTRPPTATPLADNISSDRPFSAV